MKQELMFQRGEELPLVSGVPARAVESIPQYPTLSHAQHGMFRCSVCRDTKEVEGERCMYCDAQNVPQQVQPDPEAKTVIVFIENGCAEVVQVPPGITLYVYDEDVRTVSSYSDVDNQPEYADAIETIEHETAAERDRYALGEEGEDDDAAAAE